jgi:hypothetical protein
MGMGVFSWGIHDMRLHVEKAGARTCVRERAAGLCAMCKGFSLLCF